jgi:hypothetical protein
MSRLPLRIRSTRPLPTIGDRINCDPNRDEGNVPRRWSNPNRESAVVVVSFSDAHHGRCFVYRTHRPGRSGRLHVMSELDWEVLTMWAVGPLPMPPREEDRSP